MWSRYILTGSHVSTDVNNDFERPGLSAVYFMYVTNHKHRSPKEGLQMLESHVSDKLSKRVNDDVWTELSFHLAKLRHASRNEKTTYEKVLNNLCSQLLELSDIRTRIGGHRISLQSL